MNHEGTRGAKIMQENLNRRRGMKSERVVAAGRRELPEVYQVVIECRDEEEQRELFEWLRREGRRVRLLVL